MRYVGFAIGVIAVAGDLWICGTTPSPATVIPFMAALLLPIVAAASFGLRGAPLILVCAAIYSAAAGAQRLTFPVGDVMLANQLSGTALAALVFAIALKLATGFRRQASSKKARP